MHAQRPQGVVGRHDGRDGAIHPEVPESDLPVSTAGDQLSKAAALHVDISDPLLVIAPNFHHCRGGLESLIEHSNRAVAESCDEDVAGHLVGRQGCDTGAGPCRNVLTIDLELAPRAVTRLHWCNTHSRADFGRCIPHTDHLDISCDQSLPLTLLPIKHQASVSVAGDQLRKGTEGRDHFDVPRVLIAAVDFEHTVRRARHEKCLVILVDVANLVDLRAWRISVRKVVQTPVALPVPDAACQLARTFSGQQERVTYEMASLSSATAR